MPLSDSSLDMSTTENGFFNNTEVVTSASKLFGSLATGDCSNINETSNRSGSVPCVICTHDTPVWVSVIQAVVSIFVTLANAITATALVRSSGLKQIQKVLLVNQLISDTIVGATYTYHVITVYIFYHSVTECIIRYAMLSAASAVSLTTVALLSVERITVLKFPYKYQDFNMTISQVLICLSCWCSPIITVIAGFLYADWDITECNFILLTTPKTLLIFGAPSLVIIMLIITSNLVLFQIAREHIKKIIPSFVGRDKYMKGVKMHLKATLTTASIVIPFLVTNIPQYIYFIFLAVYPQFRNKLWALQLMNCVSSLVLINSVINPIVYIWRIAELRLQLLRVICPSLVRNGVKETYMYK